MGDQPKGCSPPWPCTLIRQPGWSRHVLSQSGRAPQGPLQPPEKQIPSSCQDRPAPGPLTDPCCIPLLGAKKGERASHISGPAELALPLLRRITHLGGSPGLGLKSNGPAGQSPHPYGPKPRKPSPSVPGSLCPIRRRQPLRVTPRPCLAVALATLK